MPQWEDCSDREDSQMDQSNQWYRRPQAISECYLIPQTLHTRHRVSLLWEEWR